MSSTLIWLVALYLLVSVAIGLLAALRVHSMGDYVTAGRRLPVYVVFAAVFATWFGAETVLGISATFVREGLSGLVSDPFGASLCLVLVGLFFARPLYRMNLLTIGDFYRRRFDARVELIASVCIALSYLGWVSAQVTALGLVFNVLTDGAISRDWGMILGASIVLVYTLLGGMWSVAVTTFVQMIVIVLGLIYIAYLVSGMTGGITPVVNHAAAAGKLEFWPELSPVELIGFVAALVTMGFGSIPQQDVFQRVNASKSETTAVYGTVLGGLAYLLFAAVPLFLVYSATLVDPKMVSELMERDSQLILPTFIATHLPLGAQIVFYGALLSVIMSTASGTLLAPSVTIAENILRPRLRNLTDKGLLWMTRIVVVCFALLVTAYSLLSNETIHGMVESAYKVTLVAAFVPLAAGIYWKRATRQGALAASIAGLVTWIGMEIAAADAVVPPQFAGLLASVTGMIFGSLAPQRYGTHQTTA
jgi:Na+/proline symporter